MLIFQTSDLNGNCINLVEVPVIVDPNAASVNPDDGGIGGGDQGPDSSGCNTTIDVGIGENTIYFFVCSNYSKHSSIWKIYFFFNGPI